MGTKGLAEFLPIVSPGYWRLHVAVFSTLGTGCQNKMYDEKTALREQNRELQAKVDERNTLLQSAMPVSNIVTPDVRPVAPPPAPVAPPPAGTRVSPVSIVADPPAATHRRQDLTGPTDRKAKSPAP